MAKYQCYNDPAHGWLKVALRELRKLGIENQVSNYSYVRGEFAYLEEDCDASLFLRAKKFIGEDVEIVDNYSNKMSKIRSYMPYSVL